MTEPNWDDINRAISESIEPMPQSDAMYPLRSSKNNAWWWVDGNNWPLGSKRGQWQPRNWCEPAAAMNLLKRLLAKEYDVSGCGKTVLILYDNEPLHNIEWPVEQTEDAIMLAFYASLEGLEGVGR